MMIERTIFIARHGSREDFEDPQWVRRAEYPDDPNLTATGIREAQRLAQRMAREQIAYLYCSPYLRAVHTAHWCAAALGLSIRIEAGFGEWRNAEWFAHPPRTRSLRELQEQFPAVDGNYQSLVEPAFPESKRESIRRFGRAIEETLRRTAVTLLVVGHGATVEGIGLSLLPGNFYPSANPASLCRLDLEEGSWHLRFLNDTSHLAAGAASGPTLPGTDKSVEGHR
jgi:broad specificity phosphatase PhoE